MEGSRDEEGQLQRARRSLRPLSGQQGQTLGLWTCVTWTCSPSVGLSEKKRPPKRNLSFKIKAPFWCKCESNLSSGASPALPTSPSCVLVLLCGRAALQVDFQHRLIHKLGGTVRTRGRLLICNGPEAAFRLMGIVQQRRRG